MKKLSIYLALLVITILINSCCKNKDKYYYVSEKPGYKIGDTLMFSSNLGNQDTFFVKNIIQGFSESENADYCGTSNYYESVSFKFEYSEEDSSLFEINLGSHSFNYSIYWFGALISDSETYYNQYEYYSVNNKNYSNVFEVYKTFVKDDVIDTFYFSKQDGILKYIKSINHEAFELIEY